MQSSENNNPCLHKRNLYIPVSPVATKTCATEDTADEATFNRSLGYDNKGANSLAIYTRYYASRLSSDDTHTPGGLLRYHTE